MISVEEALELIHNEADVFPAVDVLLSDTLGYISAEDIFSPTDVPVFDNAAMDGYAFRYDDLAQGNTLLLKYEVQAGQAALPELSPGEVARIFTGAPVPPGADTVVQQEICTVDGGILRVGEGVKRGLNIRLKGSQTIRGALVFRKHQAFSALSIAYLATLGIFKVKVFPKPRVGIIITGKELVAAGSVLQPGQIYESNSVALHAALEDMRVPAVFSQWADDEAEVLASCVRENIARVDILILTGGISVGDYDLVKPVLESMQCRELFYKVKQKPGKPLYFGRHGNTLVFALPGNPASVLSCFHVYVKSAINKMRGLDKVGKHWGILMDNYYKKSRLTHFVRAVIENSKIRIADRQLSYQVDSFAESNCLAVLPAGREDFIVGEKVEVILIN